jgi:hypothetical protein
MSSELPTDTDDALTDDQYEALSRPVSDRPELKTTVDVRLPPEITSAVAAHAAYRTATDGAATVADIHDYAADHVQLWPRYLVGESDTPLVEWVADRADIIVDPSDTVVLPDRQLFEARAEYRPESEIPVHVTLDPPERVLEAAGGADQLTETIRVHLADGAGNE